MLFGCEGAKSGMCMSRNCYFVDSVEETTRHVCESWLVFSPSCPTVVVACELCSECIASYVAVAMVPRTHDNDQCGAAVILMPLNNARAFHPCCDFST